MGADKTNIDYAGRVVDSDNKPVLITFDVKYNLVAGDDAGIWVNARHIIGCLPDDVADVLIPGFKSRLSIRMLCPVASKCASGNYSHKHSIPCSRSGNNIDKAASGYNNGVSNKRSALEMELQLSHAP